MAARDAYHAAVRQALVKDGWLITDDPLTLRWGGKDTFVDLGAEKLLAAEKTGRRIAVEVKSFTGRSEVHDLEQALGQYRLYQDLLSELDPERKLYLAVRKVVFKSVFEEPLGQLVLRKEALSLLVFEPSLEVVVQWIP